MRRDISYFDNIDTLRFSAFLLVFISHIFFANNAILDESLSSLKVNLAPYAKIGVSFFFTLSSFLITWVALNTASGRAELRRFYIRRALRILPLYLLVIVLAYFAFPYVAKQFEFTPPKLPNIIWFLSFTANFYIGYVSNEMLFFLVFLWSIAVEEQFYFVWGVVLYLFRKYMLHIIIAFTIVFAVFILLHAFGYIQTVYYHTLYYLPNFSCGGFLAYIAFHKSGPYQFFVTRPKWVWASLYVTLAVALLFTEQLGTAMFVPTLKHLIFIALFGLVLFDQCFNDHRLFDIGKIRAFNYLGKISFGLYCWHGVVLTLIKKALECFEYDEAYFHIFIIYPFVVLLFTVLIASASYRYIEYPFLKLKEYF